jgi:hypothetical protein
MRRSPQHNRLVKRVATVGHELHVRLIELDIIDGGGGKRVAVDHRIVFVVGVLVERPAVGGVVVVGDDRGRKSTASFAKQRRINSIVVIVGGQG